MPYWFIISTQLAKCWVKNSSNQSLKHLAILEDLSCGERIDFDSCCCSNAPLIIPHNGIDLQEARGKTLP